MKSLLTSSLCTTLIFLFSAAAFANSGPVRWQGYPSSEIMSIDPNSPIVVKNENLVFDFSDDRKNDYTVTGKVSAAYQMVNPTNELQTVQMAFPFVGAINEITSADIGISAEHNPVPYKIYIGDVVDSYGDPRQEEKKAAFDFSTIINSIANKSYQAKNFAENEMGKLYKINVKPASDQPINLAVDFNFDFEKTKVLTNGFNGYQREGTHTKITAWCNAPTALDIFVFGEDIDLKIKAFSDGELKQATDLLTYQVSAQEIGIKKYLMDYIMKYDNNSKNDVKIGDAQLNNLYVKVLDEYLKSGMGYSSGQDLLQQGSYKRIITLIYTIEFEPNSEKEVSISYKTSGSMDKTKTIKPQYSFDYILNPAQLWRDFKKLNVKIIAPERAPYIVKSNIKFQQQDNKIYTAALTGLPQNDLSFTLYSHQNITVLDKLKPTLLSPNLWRLIKGIIVFLIILRLWQLFSQSKRELKF